MKTTELAQWVIDNRKSEISDEEMYDKLLMEMHIIGFQYIEFAALEMMSYKNEDKEKLKSEIVCPKCGGDSWKDNTSQTVTKYCKCGCEFTL